MMLTLSQGGQKAPVQVLLWLGVLIVAAIAMGLAVMYLRRRLLRNHDQRDGSQGFMQELRTMRDTGKISQEEYDRTRKTLAARLAGKSPPKLGMKPAPGRSSPPPHTTPEEDDAHG